MKIVTVLVVEVGGIEIEKGGRGNAEHYFHLR